MHAVDSRVTFEKHLKRKSLVKFIMDFRVIKRPQVCGSVLALV